MTDEERKAIEGAFDGALTSGERANINKHRGKSEEHLQDPIDNPTQEERCWREAAADWDAKIGNILCEPIEKRAHSLHNFLVDAKKKGQFYKYYKVIMSTDTMSILQGEGRVPMTMRQVLQPFANYKLYPYLLEFLQDAGYTLNEIQNAPTEESAKDDAPVDFNAICAKYSVQNMLARIAQLDDAYNFDSHILHGTSFETGTINYVVARPADGKTTTLVSLALDAIRNQHAGETDKKGEIIPRRKVFIISAEESAYRFFMRLIRNEAYYRYVQDEQKKGDEKMDSGEYEAIKYFITNSRSKSFNPTKKLIMYLNGDTQDGEKFTLPDKTTFVDFLEKVKDFKDEHHNEWDIDKKKKLSDDDKINRQALHKTINLVYRAAKAQIERYYNDGEIFIVETAKELDSTDKIRQFINAIPPHSLVLIDYVQRLKNGNDFLGSGNSRYMQIKEMSDMLAETAKDKDLITIAGAQLNRSADPYELDYSNIRESGDLEQDAFVITGLSSFFAYEEEADDDDNATRMNYMQNLKNRTSELDNRCFFVDKDRLKEMLAYSYIEYTDEGTIDTKKGTYGQKDITITIKEAKDRVTNVIKTAFKLFNKRHANEWSAKSKSAKGKNDKGDTPLIDSNGGKYYDDF